MKQFTSGFNTEKNKKTGLSPMWILKCPWPSSGTFYLSDIAYTFSSWSGGVTTKSWVADWGNIDEAISGDLGLTKVSDFSLSLLIDPDASPSIDTILWTAANNIETTDLELYLWFRDLTEATDPPVKMWTGNIVDFEKISEILYSVQFVDQSVRFDRYVGEKVDLTTYPNADPDDVGKVKNIVYGDVERIPCLLLESGAVTSLKAAITSSQTDFYLSDGTGLVATDVIQIDEEKISITTISGAHITACTRGYDSTTAVAHSKGSTAWEVPTNPFVYMFADHPVKSIDKVWVKISGDILVDITSDCTIYTGQSGSNYTGYSNRYSDKAVIVISNYPAIQQKVALAANDTIAVSDDIDFDAPNSTINTTPTTGTSANLYDGNTGTYLDRGSGSTTASVDFGGTFDYGSIQDQWVHWVVSSADSGTVVFHPSDSVSTSWTCTGLTPSDFRIPRSGTPLTWHPSSRSVVWDSGSNLRVYEAYLETEYIPALSKTGEASKSGTVTVTGNSTANSLVGEMVLADGEGWQDDSSGTFTGTASALIRCPHHVIRHLLHNNGVTENYLENGNMESWSAGDAVAPDGWTLYGSGAAVLKGSAGGKFGQFYAMLERNGNDCYLCNTNATNLLTQLPLLKGKTTVLSAYVWADTANVARIGLTDGVSSNASSYHTGGTSWELLSVSITIDSDATNLSCFLECKNTNESVAFDGVVLREGSSAPTYLSTGSLNPVLPAVDFKPRDNYLENGSFETWTAGTSAAPDGWYVTGAGATIARDTGPADIPYGIYTAKLTRAGTDCYLINSNYVRLPIESSGLIGKTITLSVKVYCDTANAARVGINDGEAGAYSSYHTGGGGGDWETLTVSYTLPTTAKCVAMILEIKNTNCSAWFDGAVMLDQASVAYPAVDVRDQYFLYFKFDGVISEHKKLKEWLAVLSWQSLLYCRFYNSQVQLINRVHILPSAKTITAAMIGMNEDGTTSIRISRSPLEQIINKIEVKYNRDWANLDREPYKNTVKMQDDTSITRYGEKEHPELFNFDFVTTNAMAWWVAAIYKFIYAYRKKIVTGSLFLDNSELEFSDGITITPLTSLFVELLKGNFRPGSGKEERIDLIEFEGREFY